MLIRLFETGGYTILASNLEEARKTFKKTMKRILKKDVLNSYINDIKETNYERSFTYFDIEEIKEAHRSFIYDYKYKKEEETPYIASLPLTYACEYASYTDRYSHYKMPSVLPWATCD